MKFISIHFALIVLGLGSRLLAQPLPAILHINNEFILSEAISDQPAFLGWRLSSNNTSNLIPSKLARKAILCEDKKLYPTHPSMILKKYFLVYVGKYQVTQLTRNSLACKLSSPDLKNQRCILADDLYHYIVSDTYRDRCGNLYRGFIKRQFFKSKERIETLFSPGRSVVKTPGSTFSGDYTVANTASVDSVTFEIITDLFPGDLEGIQKELHQLEKVPGVKLNVETLTFEMK